MSCEKKGFSLIEVILAVSLFAILAVALGGSFIYGELSLVSTYEREKAFLIAQEGQDVVRWIRDQDFALLVAGSYGIIENTGQWEFQASPDVTDSRYTRTMTINDQSTSTKEILAQVTWQDSLQQSKTITLNSLLTNWQETINTAGEIVFDASGMRLRSRDRRLQRIDLENIGTTDITLVNLVVTWSGANADYITQLRLQGGPIEYNCSTAPLCPGSGDNIPFNFTLDAGDTTDIRRLNFNQSFAGADFSLLFTDSNGNDYLLDNLSI